MYKGFIIDDFEENLDFSDVNTKTICDFVRKSLLNENEYITNDIFNSCLSDFIIQDTIDKDIILDGSRIVDVFFPNANAYIFISRSHKDVDVAKEFAKNIYIDTCLKSFIDYEVWNYADDLLNGIYIDYCLKSNGSYSYERRNVSTSYVHMMLNTALLNMIDRCECLFFLSTTNSFKKKKEIKNTTFSPWIYFEINVANSLITDVSVENFAMREGVEDSMIEMAFEADLKRFDKVNIRGLLGTLGIELPLSPKGKFSENVVDEIFHSWRGSL